MIKIDQIRELESFVFVGSHREGNRVVLITEADAMNQPAANSLLKILEEPPASVYFILVSSKSKSLLPTIRSRCRVIPFGAPDAPRQRPGWRRSGLEKQAVRYLDLAAGAPMRVAQWKEQGQLAPIDALVDSLIAPPADPIALAARWDALLKGDGCSAWSIWSKACSAGCSILPRKEWRARSATIRAGRARKV
jgi:DNA polymerase-3 subunit delta'